MMRTTEDISGRGTLDADVTVSQRAPEDPPLPAHTVIGERYEVREELRRDGLSRSYLAFDQEAEEPVLLRRLAADLVAPGKPMRAVLDRLRPKLGLGGRFLSGPMDADIEEDRLYVVEPLPRGVPLSAVMRRRTSEERAFGAKEVLPIVAQVAAALACIPPPHAHLEVTARQIWIDPEGSMLTGSFLLGCLEASAIARVLARDTGLASSAAPELRDGNAGDAADYFSVGRLTHALLLPTEEALSALTLGPVAEAITGLTQTDRGSRATSLDPLVEGLARLGGLPTPELDPGAYRRPRARRRPSKRAPAPREEVSAMDARLVRAAKAADAARDIDPRLLRAARSTPEDASPEPHVREIPGAASGGTQEISLDQIVDEAPLRDDLDGLDPRLVRAALDMELDDDSEEEIGEELDELLVEPEEAAAPAAPVAREATQEVTLDQIVDEVPNREDLDSIDPVLLQAALAPKSAPAEREPRAAPDTMELTLEDLQAEDARAAMVPEGVKPLPRPRRPSSPGLKASPALYDDSRSLPAIDAATLARISERPPPAQRRRSDTGAKRVMLLSIVLGLLIVLASLGYAAYRHRVASEQRQQRLEERYRQLQEEAHSEPEPEVQAPR
ncbi:MAG: hypothetical protein GXP55_15570 [Deltaproteobacteria bacterium]|nr:hypothetical protein [Deltaproteobacteria bacterium]